MSDDADDPNVSAMLADLTAELRTIQREVSPDSRSIGRDLARFTSEVAIPALILILKANIQLLELLRRTIRIAEGREPRPDRKRSRAREQAEALGQVTLSRLDTVLSELSDAVEGRPTDEQTQSLIEEAQSLRAQIEAELDGSDLAANEPQGQSDNDGQVEDGLDSVDIDVEAELRSLKDELDADCKSDDVHEDGPGAGGDTAAGENGNGTDDGDGSEGKNGDDTDGQDGPANTDQSNGPTS